MMLKEMNYLKNQWGYNMKNLLLILPILFVASCGHKKVIEESCKLAKSVDIPALIRYGVGIGANGSPLCIASCFDLDDNKRVEDSLCGHDFVAGEKDFNECTFISGYKIVDWEANINPRLGVAIGIRNNVCK